jgi:glycosyltransferase involved in cell wall biosynthesis
MSGAAAAATPRLRVFLAGASLAPIHSGVAYSVCGLANALARAGIEVGVWAPDGSAATTPLLASNLPLHRLTGTEAEALSRFPRPDILHDNGIWWPHNHRLAGIAQCDGIARVVSTRGMLEPWAMNHKRWKKRLAWGLYQRCDLTRARCHHTTSDAEAGNVQRLALDVPVCVIPNGIDVPALEAAVAPGTVNARPAQWKRALFLGRIYPVKGLPMLVEAWARVRPDGWVLQIAGPDEAGHRAQVERAVAAAGLNDVVCFSGPVEGDAKRRAFLDADLFVLPTHSENFGTVVAEAMAHGLPVLTTTAAPWPVVRDRGCGWWIEPTVDGIAQGLLDATRLDGATLRAMGSKGREFAAANYGWEGIAKRFMSMYELVKANANTAPVLQSGRGI